MIPWETIAHAATADGPLELRRRGGDFLMTVAGRVLMTSAARRSEEELARLAVAALPHGARAPRVLVGGLGMGFTLRAALDALPPAAQVVVVELNPDVVAWCRRGGPLAGLTAEAADDRRVELRVGDVAAAIRRAPRASFDAVILDLYEGPYEATQRRADPFYGPAALAATRAALRSPGVFAVWSEEPDAAFTRRLVAAGFRAASHRRGRGGRAHVVYLATC